MNRLTIALVLKAILCCTSCGSWHMNEHRNIYTGSHRSFDMKECKYRNNESRWCKLVLYNDSIFSFSEISGSHPFKSGSGTWHDCGDYIILNFNRYERNPKQRMLEERLLGCTTFKSMCIVLKKKGRKNLKLLPGNVVLRNSY